MAHSDDDLTEIPSLTLGDDEIRSHSVLNPHRPEQAQQPVQANSGHRALWLLLALIFCLSGAGGYSAWQQLSQLQEALAQSQQQADAAQQQLTQLQQQFDGKLASTQASGAAIGAQLKESNSEIRKLWDLAHKRNRPAITELTGALKDQQTRIDNLEKALAQSQKQLGALEQHRNEQAALKEQLDSQAKKVAQLQSANDVTLALLQEQLHNLKTEQQKISQQAAQQKQNYQQLAKKSQAFDDAVRSLDSYRQQINRQLLNLQQQLQTQ